MAGHDKLPLVQCGSVARMFAALVRIKSQAFRPIANNPRHLGVSRDSAAGYEATRSSAEPITKVRSPPRGQIERLGV